MKPMHPGFGLAPEDDGYESSGARCPDRSRVRRWVRLAWSACFAARADQQQWTWFLPNPLERPSANGSHKESESCKT